MTSPSSIPMPRLTDQMEQGTIVAWLVADGQAVARGQELVEIGTDKATLAHASEAEGVLRIVARVGDTVAVGETIALVGVASPASARAAETPRAAGARAAVSPLPDARGSTPLARRVAAAHGIELASVRGSGTNGRITKADVLAAAGVAIELDRPDAPARHRAVGPPASATERGAPPAPRIRQPTRLQRVVARRMTEAATAVPQFQVQCEVVADPALELRAAIKAEAAGEAVPSLNDLVVKACALALRGHPLVNGSFTEDGYELHDEVCVGIAVDARDGLLVATIREADRKSLGTIARESRELAERARSGKASPGELTGATFTVSNLGMLGMTAITPLINPPQAAILGVGAARATLARGDDGAIVDRRLLTLTLSGDHRILNGADGARFLLEVKECLEAPLRLTL